MKRILLNDDSIDKKVYQFFLNEKELKTTVNGNLLKSCHDRISYESIIIIEHKNL